MKSATQNLHVPLPAKLYRALHSAAKGQGRPATQVAREAIVLWLERTRREKQKQSLDEYIQAMAGSRDDLDPDLEAASSLLTASRRRRK